MNNASPRIAIIGDYDERKVVHQGTHAEFPAAGAKVTWIPTDSIGDPAKSLRDFDGIIISPGSPYIDEEAVIASVRYARENRVPLVGMCAGFQYVVVEFVRHVLGVAGANHAETHPDAEKLAVTPLVCSLAGESHPVLVVPETRAASAYRQERVIEPFFCNYGINPEFEPRLEAAGLHVSGRDEMGRPRIIELADHPFFLATLYVFQVRERYVEPHPLTAAFLEAARARS
ncbi:hypothetical protein LZC95_06155 [Pendulispora brunnea]|uniref:CTP synthase (glutamine hydrolyzing) n=1 Tax=Pendulispora brunnea TaxID=2905690 RepID=A0ABZ2KCM6_9BACT